jgi:hypothetical protein
VEKVPNAANQQRSEISDHGYRPGSNRSGKDRTARESFPEVKRLIGLLAETRCADQLQMPYAKCQYKDQRNLRGILDLDPSVIAEKFKSS